MSKPKVARTEPAAQLGLGCASIGNLFVDIPSAQACDIVKEAWNVGIRWFDTAPYYGVGLSERRLGLALADLIQDGTASRGDMVVSTKVGRTLIPSPHIHSKTPDQKKDLQSGAVGSSSRTASHMATLD
eukprot:gene3041-592_t